MAIFDVIIWNREALMSGDDNSAITENSFVRVCRKYGLIQLVSNKSASYVSKYWFIQRLCRLTLQIYNVKF